MNYNLPIKIGNRVTEKDIRQWLDKNGFMGRSAKINNLELHAVTRPGWKQVFRFRAQVKTNNQTSMEEKSNTNPYESGAKDSAWLQRWGIVLDDERERKVSSRTQIWIFESEEEFLSKLETVSKDILTTGTNHWLGLVVLAAMFITLLLIASLVSSFL